MAVKVNFSLALLWNPFEMAMTCVFEEKKRKIVTNKFTTLRLFFML